jgi:hypothetical protein
MSCLSRPVSIRARGCLVACPCLLFGICAGSSSLHAAPVTLQFEAIVGPPRQGADGAVPPSWNISLQPGDTISGTFTFEPHDAPSGA